MKKIALFLLIFPIFLLWCAYGEPIDNSNSSDAGNDVQLRDASLSDGGFDLAQESKMPIFYRGGKVMTKPITVYIIWYGAWAGKTTVNIIKEFINSFGSSNYYNTNINYYQINDAGIDSNTNSYVSNDIKLGQELYMMYDYGMSLSQPDIQEIIFKKILGHELPLDENGIYLLITDKNVAQNWMTNKFCIDYCGWHTFDTLQNINVKYMFVGDTEKCPFDCSAKLNYLSLSYSHSPNDDWSADGMVSIIAHELSETITDPELNSWRDAFGKENSDKCAYVYQQVYETSNHSVANVKIGNKDYLIQSNWFIDPSGTNQHCSLR